MTTISIITVSYNSAETITDCLESVRTQTFPSEHIIIDGGSTDETITIVEACRDTIAIVVSEPDKGIYDAMNKGIRLATGDVIGFLNADDIYNGLDALAKVAELFKDESLESCFADLVYVGTDDVDKIVRYWKSGEFSICKIYNGWIPPHPTFFVRRRVYEKFGEFNLEAGIAADYELMLRFLLKNQISTKYLGQVLVRMRLGGVSNSSLKSRINNARSARLGWQLNGLTPYPWTLLLRSVLKVRQFLTGGAKL